MSPAFKIERFVDPEEIQSFAENTTETRHKELLARFDQLDEKISTASPSENQVHEELDEDLKKQVEDKQAELIRLKDEMRAIYAAIDDTKRQILTIKESGSEGQEMARAAEGLSAIVKGTEEATNGILQSAEMIETNSANLIAAIDDESQQALACEIQESVVGIFEACNFQDLTGQRITKVVKTFCFIEQRVLNMMEIWGGADGFMHVTPEELEARKGEKGLLNGPALNDDSNVASQDDIDALFD